MYNTYMPNKTISVPSDVIPIIESLDVPFSRWVTDQLRRHAAATETSFADQLLADAALVTATEGDTEGDVGARPSKARTVATGEQMGRSAPW